MVQTLSGIDVHEDTPFALEIGVAAALSSSKSTSPSGLARLTNTVIR
jgi:hypothetical protein